MNAEVTSKLPPRKGSLSLLDAVIVILTSCSILIFVFTIGAKFLGQATFDKLPDFIKDSYSAIWSAGVVAGGALVGSVVDALSKEPSTKANFIVYILGTTILIMSLIVGIVELSRNIEGPQFLVPMGATAIDLHRDSTQPIEFYLQNRLGFGNQVRISGTYSIKEGQLTGNVTNSEIDPVYGVAPGAPVAAIKLNSLSVHVCYLAVRNGAPTYTQAPAFPTSSNSQGIATTMNIGSPYKIPNFAFTISTRNLDYIAPPYLCAFIDGELNSHMTYY
jgi:hypothetical protein